MKNVKIIGELQRLSALHHGLLLPETVVAAARNPKSPLHKRFEWSDTKAAQKYRLWQARQLISVTVQVLEGSKDEVPVFVSLSSDRGEGGYRVLTHVLSRQEMRDQLLRDALSEANLWARKYSNLRQLAQVFTAIKRVKAA